VVDIFRRIDRQIFAGRQFCYGAEPHMFVGVILMGEHSLNFDSGIEQFFNADATNVVLG